MTLIAILIATLAAGIGSVWAAALLMRMGLGGRHDGVGPQHLLSLAAGALLATAFMHLLPEAFESQAGAHDLFATLLVGVVSRAKSMGTWSGWGLAWALRGDTPACTWCPAARRAACRVWPMNPVAPVRRMCMVKWAGLGMRSPYTHGVVCGSVAGGFRGW